MIWFPPAKINLGLNILRKRPDGFHDLETCFYPLGWTDVLEIIPAEKFSFSSSGLEIPDDPANNLCVKAYKLLHQDFDLPPVNIHLHKIIPMGAGLGGGSSDAAYTLRGLNEIFELNLDVNQLHAYASTLGSDCAFFLYDEPMMAEGKGEILKRIDDFPSMGEFTLLVVYPEIHVPTAQAYQRLTPNDTRESLEKIIKNDPYNWKRQLTNDFEESVFKVYPLIKEVKEKFYQLDAVYASMSGSGSAVFGLFERINFDPEEEFKGYKIFRQKL